MGRPRGRTPATERWNFPTAADMAQQLPHHFRQVSDLPMLTEQERESFARCEAAIETLKLAFWAAGKALQIVRDGRLYRAEYESFDAYCVARWDLQRDYADRLIRAWPVAEQLHGVAQRRLAEAQVRELVPLAEKQGTDAAAAVFKAVQDGPVPVTAAVLKGAVRALPDGPFDAEAAAEEIRRYLATLLDTADGTSANDDAGSGPAVDAEARAARAVPYGWLRKVAREDPEAAAGYLDALQRQIDRARSELLPGPRGTD